MIKSRQVPIVALMLLGIVTPLSAGPVGPTTQVTPSDQIQFQQKNIQAQMRELEERMFHLAELIREMEPGDSAKLIMAVRRAREQLIVEQMKEVLELIGTKDLNKASDEQKQVLVKLEELKKVLLAQDLDLQMQLEQLRKLNEALKKLDVALKDQKTQQADTNKMADAQKKNTPVDIKKFQTAQANQNGTKKATEAVKQITSGLGELGTKATASLGNANGSQGKASNSLSSSKGSDALVQQTDAVKQMEDAKKELEQQREKLVAEIERQVRKQVIANLTEMLERQQSVRQVTQQLSSRATANDREAMLRVKQLATAEGHIVTIAGHTIELIEETGFSLALPPALKNIERRCVYVQNDLQQSRAGQPVIAAEVAVERDLKDLIDTFKELQSSTAQPSQCKGCKGDRNKLLAELKVLKMLQVRVNEETKDADGSRAAALQELPAALKQKIGTVRDNQQQVEEATDAIHKRICPDCLNEN